jgi:hypothetical protein
MALRATQIRGELTELVEGMDLDVISGADAAVLVREYSLIEKIAASARTLAAARVAETSAWVGEGDRSAEDWLSRQTGTSVGAAARDLRTGERVKDQPKTKAAMKQGTLSPEQAGAVAEAVEVDPAAETTLIEAAKHETYKNLHDQARRVRAAATDDAERASRHHRERSARTGTDADGAFCLSLRGPASDGARILALLKPLQEQAFLRARANTAAARETFDNRTYDAILAMLLTIAAPATRPAPPTGPAPAGDPTPPSSTATNASATHSGKADTSVPTAARPPSPGTTDPGDDKARCGRPSNTPAANRPPHEPATPHTAFIGPDPTRLPGADVPSLFDAEGSSSPAMQQATSTAVAGPAHPSPPPPAPPEVAIHASDPADNGPLDHRSPDAGPPDHGPPRSEPPNTPVSPPSRLPGGNNTKVIVRVDLDALLRGRTIAGETSEIAGLGPVPVSVVRDMLNDAFLAVVVTKGRDIVSVAHHGRGLNVHQRTAIEAQGLRCSNITCNQSVGIQIDHRHPWAKNQITKLDNQDPLCGPCHRRKTHEGWQLEAGAGPRRFLPPAQTG